MTCSKLLLATASALLALAACKSAGDAGAAAQETILVAHAGPVSAHATWTKLYSHKLGVALRFHNAGEERVHFPFTGITLDYEGTVLEAQGVLRGANDVELEPGAERLVRVYFHTKDAGLGEPGAGSYVLEVAGLRKADGTALGVDLVIPVVVP